MKTMMTNNRIYLDYAASTPVDPRVLLAMEPYWCDLYAHPWSGHSDGEKSLEAINNARNTIAHALGILGHVTERELIFTSGGTESNALALKGALEFVESRRGSLTGLHLMVGTIEHPSVRGIGTYAVEKGMEVDYIPVDHEGIVDVSFIKTHLRPETVLLSCQYVNSEIGTIQPLDDIANIIRESKREKGAQVLDREENVLYPLFHSDASQAPLWLPLDVQKLGVDLLTLDAHKIYGPKGIGALYSRKGTPLKSIFLGTEEKSFRSGTPAVPLIVGFAEAITITEEERRDYMPKVEIMRDYLIQELRNFFPHIRINGSLEKRVANNVSITFPHINHEFLQVQLDQRGISVATKSACLEEGGEGSYVVSALGAEYKSALRITLGKETTREEIEEFLNALKELIVDNKK